MTHSYEDIIRLDSERTQGDWEFHDGGRKNDWSESSWVQIPEHFDDNGNDSDDVIYLRLTANAQYIAAMPDAVGLLKLYKQLLDRAIQGLEEVSHEADEVYGIGKDNTRFCGDIAKQILADIRKALDGDKA